MIRVLVVEDSPVTRKFLVYVLSSDAEISVVGMAADGEEALREVARKKPDVITMDINMPKMNGLDATREIMQTQPTPIVIVSGSWDTNEVSATFQAVEAGAVAVLPRPQGIGHPDYEKTAKALIQTVKSMSEVKVIRRWRNQKPTPVLFAEPQLSQQSMTAEIRVVAIGASTGGPVALQGILAELKKDFPVPIMIVQHMSSGFIDGFAKWLSETTFFPTQIAIHGEQLLPGRAYISPDDYHLGVAAGDRILLSSSEPQNGLRPSACYLFRSVANLYGARAIGVLLTGMGTDGAEGLKQIKETGGITFAQDKESSVVYGMPAEAVRLGAAKFVLSPPQIAVTLMNLLTSR